MSESALERDLYEERRRKWRRSGFWRGVLVTVGVLVALIVGLGFLIGTDEPLHPHIATYDVNGIIVDDPNRVERLASIAQSDSARALIVRINSGGGTTVGSEALYAALRDVAETKPVVAVMGEAAASGAYVTALAADHIVARGNTLTGSIGVILEYPDVTALMERVGVDVVTFRSSDIKGDPSPFRAQTPEGRAVLDALVEDSQQWFLGLVAERRRMTPEQAADVGNGRVFTGRMALEQGLIDEIGGQEAALGYLAGVDEQLSNLPLESWNPSPRDALLPGVNSLVRSVAGETQRWVAGPRLMSVFR